MKRLCAAAGPIALALFAGSACAQLAPDQCADYRGKLGTNSEISLRLLVRDKTVTGSDFYKKYLGDIPLAASYQSARDITLKERDQSGKGSGTFELRFVESDASRRSVATLSGDIRKGTWSYAAAQRTLPVFLSLYGMRPGKCSPRYEVAGAKDDALVERNAQAFYNAIRKGQKSLAAKYVGYPATFRVATGRQKIANSAEFGKVCDQLFTPAFVARIITGIPHHMSANAQGIMLADGAAWFNENGKAIAFDNAQ
jgi:hypothetical protein